MATGQDWIKAEQLGHIYVYQAWSKGDALPTVLHLAGSSRYEVWGQILWALNLHSLQWPSGCSSTGCKKEVWYVGLWENYPTLHLINFLSKQFLDEFNGSNHPVIKPSSSQHHQFVNYGPIWSKTDGKAGIFGVATRHFVTCRSTTVYSGRAPGLPCPGVRQKMLEGSKRSRNLKS